VVVPAQLASSALLRACVRGVVVGPQATEFGALYRELAEAINFLVSRPAHAYFQQVTMMPTRQAREPFQRRSISVRTSPLRNYS
jgi:hypothetical protein